jgi:predicted RNase H-like HicB family nuclease
LLTGEDAAGDDMKMCVHITSDGQGGFTALCPSLPGCLTKAKTREEVREQIRKAIAGYLAAMGNFVPENLEPELLET